MKKLILLLAIMVLSHDVFFAQSCLPEGITFTTQEEIDNFQTNNPGCTEIEGNVNINGLNQINNLNGLIGLTAIGGNLRIHQNFSLTSLSGLNNLVTLGGSLEIAFNPMLLSLAGLENIDPGSLDDLVIHDNSALENCGVESVCEYLSSPNGHVDIYNNAGECRNAPAIAAACGFSLSCLPFGDYYFFSQADVDNFNADYSNCTELAGIVKISGNDITNLNSLNEVTSMGVYLAIIQNPLLNSLSGLVSLFSVDGAVSIGYNPSLTNLEGLENLTSVGGYLSIYNNNTLTKLMGLENLTTIGDMLEIIDNENLVDLTALNNLTNIGNFLWIRHNTSLTSLSGLDHIAPGSITYLVLAFNFSLTTCEVESICIYLAAPNGTIEIHDNAPGCNSQAEVEQACLEIGIEEPAVGNQQFPVMVYPNPFDGSITFEYFLDEDALVNFSILDHLGRQVALLVNEKQHKGRQVVAWNAKNLPPGVYYCRLKTGNQIISKKIIKMK
jgi:hypothetical protein